MLNHLRNLVVHLKYLPSSQPSLRHLGYCFHCFRFLDLTSFEFHYFCPTENRFSINKILVQCASPKRTCIVNAYCQFFKQACTNFMQTYLYWHSTWSMKCYMTIIYLLIVSMVNIHLFLYINNQYESYQWLFWDGKKKSN